MKVIKTSLDGCVIIEPDIFHDERGFFLETYQKERYKNEAGINVDFVQDNFSRSYKNVLRGLHFQKHKPQGKLVRVLRGKVLDVAVDIRQDSNTFGDWVSVELSSDNKKQLWVPPGFAHGFLVISDTADFAYKCSDFYDSSDEGTIIWNDPLININWPISDPSLSHKDAVAQSLSEIRL